MCLGVIFFAFILLRVHQTSQICKFISFAKFGKFETLFLQVFFLNIALLFPWNLHMLDVLILSYISLTPYSFHFQFFLCSLNWIISIDLISISLTFTSVIFADGPIKLFSYFRYYIFQFKIPI